MKLVIREYLASIRERGELDAILPDMLAEMGFTVYSRPSVGGRQYGVDVAAVGPGQDGVRRVHLFSVKMGNLDRRDWDTSSPQSLRPSLNEIKDAYLPSRIPPEYAHLPVVICLCFGGDMDEKVRAEVTGYINANTSKTLTYEEWNGDRLAQAILDGLLREDLLPSDLRSHLRKAVAMVEEPDIAINHYRMLISEIVSSAGDKQRDRLRRARLINICLWILFVWARESGNVEAAYRASEISTLYAWQMLKNDLGKKSKGSVEAGLVFSEIVDLHFSIWDELFETKLLPYANARHALSTAVGSHASVDVNLKLFDTIGRIAMHGLWMVWSVSGHHILPTRIGDEVAQAELDAIDRLGAQLMEIVSNNRALLAPIGDWQAVELGLAFTFLAMRPQFHTAINEWMDALSNNTIFAFKTHGHYPTTQKSYWDLVGHPSERSDEYRQECTEGSVLFPLLALWATGLGNETVLERVANFHTNEAPWCNYQLWLPDEDSEHVLYTGAESHGAVLSQIPVTAGTTDAIDLVYHECSINPHFGQLTAIQLGHWPILLMACLHYSLPVPPQIWQDFLPNMARLIDTKSILPETGATKPASHLKKIPSRVRKEALHFSAGIGSIAAGTAYRYTGS